MSMKATTITTTPTTTVRVRHTPMPPA
jgi:hypothetical protein